MSREFIPELRRSKAKRAVGDFERRSAWWPEKSETGGRASGTSGLDGDETSEV